MIKNSRGMTLIEILIVLAILGSLIAVLAPNLMSRFDKSKVQTTKLAMSNLVNSLNQYYADCSKYPSSLESLSKADADCSNWGPEPYVKVLPKDGWNKDFVYSVEGSNYVIKSLGKDGREGGDGYNKDITSDEAQ